MRTLFRLAVLTVASSISSLAPGQIGSIPPPPAIPLPEGARSNPNAARFTVTGSVVNSVTGEPIGRALVQLNGPDSRSAFTGADGRFQMDNVPEGQYSTAVQKPGYMSEDSAGGSGPIFRQGRGRRVAPGGGNHMVTVGSTTESVQLKLIPQASIEGRLTDNNGEPIEDIAVHCERQFINNGVKQWQMAGSARTDERGAFRIDSVAPGSYLLKTEQRQVFPGFEGESVNQQIVQQVFPARFYPNAADRASAQQVTVRPGEQAQADFTVPPVPAFKVSGTATPVQYGGFVTARDADGEEFHPGVQWNPNSGRWQIPALPAGEWTLSFRSQRHNSDSMLYAEQTVNVSSSDLRNLQVAMAPLPSIPLSVTAPGDNSQAPAQVQVQLESAKGLNSMSGFLMGVWNPANLSENSSIRDAAPGEYNVRVNVFGNGKQCLESVSSGGIDLARGRLIVTPGSQPAPIDVTLGNTCASIQGRVHSDAEIVTATLLLLPASHAINPQTVPIQSDGSFTLTSLSAGEYQIYAFSKLDGLEYANPEALRGFNGEQITLSPNQQATVNLNLNAREAN